MLSLIEEVGRDKGLEELNWIFDHGETVSEATMEWVARLGGGISYQKWVRGRAMAFYFMVFFGGMAFGGILWGIVAESSSTLIALMIAAGGLGLSVVWRFLFPLGEFERMDNTPTPFVPEHRPEDVPAMPHIN